MVATAKAPRTTAPRSRRPGRPALPPAGPPVIVSISSPGEDEVVPEPERVPIFEIDGKVYMRLKESPPTLGIAALDYADRKGGAGFGEIYLLREMMGSEALNALIDAGEKRWITKAQYDAITDQVVAAALGLEEKDLPNR